MLAVDGGQGDDRERLRVLRLQAVTQILQTHAGLMIDGELALADAFECGVNELPLSLVLSWFEQKAIVVLLTLLSLGIKDIRVGPTAPGFLTPNLINTLNQQFGLKLISTVENDLEEMLAA